MQKGILSIDFGGERIFTLDVIQHCFTNGGPGGGHLAAKSLFGVGLIDYPDIEELFMMTGGSLIHAGRTKTVEKVNVIFDRFDEIGAMSPYEQKVRDVSFNDMLEQLPEYRYRIIYIMMPALGKVNHIRYRNEAMYEAMLVVFAIKRWELEKGVLPVDLDELVEAGLLDKLPDDPFSDGSLVYRPDGEDFTLYSVSRDFTDGGGVAGTDKRGRYRLWEENGDAVFWPVR